MKKNYTTLSKANLPCQIEPKPGAVCLGPLLGPHHPNHHHHFHSEVARRRHPLQHLEGQQQVYPRACLKVWQPNIRELIIFQLIHFDMDQTIITHSYKLPLGAGVFTML